MDSPSPKQSKKSLRNKHRRKDMALNPVPDTTEADVDATKPRKLSQDSSEDTLIADSQPEDDMTSVAPDAMTKTEKSNGDKSYATVTAQGDKDGEDVPVPLEKEKTQLAGNKRRKTWQDTRPYPQLPNEKSHQRQRHEREAWRAAGIRFAPIKTPLKRRLQTAAVFFHCMSIVLLMSLFWFTCANPLTWPLLLIYLAHLSTSTAASNGKLSYRSEWLRGLPLWRLFAGYFPMTLHKTHELPPNRRYIFGYHPHGIISHGAWCAFATNALGFSQKFPGITNSLLTLDSNFRLPFYRDWILAMGIRSVSKDSIRNLLSTGGPSNDGQGRAVTIVIGGARESLEAQPGTLRLILRSRKGFVKMALRNGADLVPVIGFGENDLYDQLSPRSHPLVHKLQMFVLKVFKFTIPALHGRGLLNYDVGLLPYRRQVDIVVGRPIRVEGSFGSQPSQEDIDYYHDLYVQEVERLFEAYNGQFNNGVAPELQILA